MKFAKRACRVSLGSEDVERVNLMQHHTIEGGTGCCVQKHGFAHCIVNTAEIDCQEAVHIYLRGKCRRH